MKHDTEAQVEELQYQLHDKGKEVDTTASALGSALEELDQLQSNSQKVLVSFFVGTSSSIFSSIHRLFVYNLFLDLPAVPGLKRDTHS